MKQSRNDLIKTIVYSPPEISLPIRATLYLEKPLSIESETLKSKKKVLLIVDGNLDEAKIKTALSYIHKYVKSITVFKLDYGDKNIERVKCIWDEMIKTSPDIAIALGGGTVCDLVGFAASCYHRKLDHIFFPTTLLSMVDACIGGKTGIDFGGIKNSIGHVHYALESYCIFPFLETLEYQELISGFSEVIKVAMLFDSDLLEEIGKLPIQFDYSREWFVAVARGVELKAKMSEQLFSQRSKLLYGHNIGHGLETSNQVHRRHGDCVSVGMNYELALAVVTGWVNKDLWHTQNQLIKRFKLPHLIPSGMDFELIKAKMRKYRLFKDNKYLFIIPKKLGVILENNGCFYSELNEKELNSAYKEANTLLFS